MARLGLLVGMQHMMCVLGAPYLLNLAAVKNMVFKWRRVEGLAH